MRIQTILNEVNTSNASLLLENNWNDLTFIQKNQIFIIEKELKPIFDNLSHLFLVEKELTVDEIYSIFDNAVGKAEEDNNRTRLGKLKDLTASQIEKLKELDAKIKELGKTIQNTEPVKDFDDKFTALEQKILTKYKDKKVVKLFEYLRVQAKEKPNAGLIIIGIITAGAAILAGPLGGAAAGFLSNTIVKLLQEERFSTAIGSSLKAAMFGSLVELTLVWITSEIIENITYAKYDEIDKMKKSIKSVQLIPLNNKLLTRNEGLVKFLHADTLQTYALEGTVNNFNYNYDLIVTPKISDNIITLQNSITTTKEFSKEFYEAILRFHDYLARVQNSPLQNTYRSVIEAISRINDKNKVLTYDHLVELMNEYNSVSDAFNELTKREDILNGVLQKIAQQASEKGIEKAEELKKIMFKSNTAEHVEEDKPLSLPSPVMDSLTYNDIVLEESIFSDAVDKLKAAGKNLTNIVTKDKLVKAWEKAGKPTDSEKIVKILSIYFNSLISSQLVNGENTVDTKTIPPSIDNIPTLSSQDKNISKNDKLDKIVNIIKNNKESQKIIDIIKNKLK